jgi:membrane protease YdiL (CAAX protease family)
VENIEDPMIDVPVDAQVEEITITPDNPPWNAWVALAYWILSVIFIVVVPAVFLFPYLLSQHLNLRDRRAVTDFIFSDPTAIVLQLAPVMLAHILTLAAGWFVVTRFNRYSFRKTLGWTMNGFRWWHAIVITVLFYGFGLLMSQIFGHVDNEFERLIEGSRIAVYLVAILATFTAPLVEEVVYRGVLYSAFQRKFGFTLGIIIVTLLFTIVHVPQYSQNGVPDYGTVITLLVLSLGLTLLRAGTGNLLPCIILHTVFNGAQSVLLILEPYIQTSTDKPVDPTGFLVHLLK